MTGEVLGHYRVLETIGSGGMGEVYHARDDRLDRDVAIKVLKSSLTRDPDRLRRFEQEARAAAALNHPNIVAVYDIGVHDGTPYIVTELLEGLTLRQRLYDGCLPLRQVSDYGAQIAQALVSAHEKKIVHRDLKPENLFITKDGRVKVLDFGIAKLISAENRPDLSEEDAIAFMTTQTKAGSVLGTVAYMSPEQLRGHPVDHRSDIFSLGAVIYEMVTAKRAFHGETEVDTITAVLKDEPQDLSQFRDNVPAAFDQIIRHCLEKDPAQRFQSAKELAFALSTVADSSTSRLLAASRTIKARSNKKVWLLGVVATLALAGGIVFDRGLQAGSPPEYHRLTFERGTVFSARFAPDGRSIVYSASWNGRPSEVYSTVNDSLVARPLGYPTTQLLSVSPTNELALALHANNGSEWSVSHTLASAPLVGGSPREILEQVFAADWSPQGTLAVSHHVEGHVHLEFPPDNILYETAGWIGNLRFSPKGDKLAFLEHPLVDDDRGSVCVTDIEGHHKTLSSGWESVQGLAWSPDGKEIWFTAVKQGNTRSLWAVDLTDHPPHKILAVPAGLTLQDIARDGRVLVTIDDEQLVMNWAARGSREIQDLSWFNWTIAKDVSNDGQWVFFEESGEPAGDNYLVGIRRTDGSPPIRLGEGAGGSLSPDGKWALAILPSVPEHLVLYPTGPGQPIDIQLPGIDHIDSARFLNDGARITFSASEAGRPLRTFVVDLTGKNLHPVTPEGQVAGVSSPDGKYLISTAKGTNLELLPVDHGEPRPIPGSLPQDVVAQWSADSKALYVYQTGEVPLNIYRLEIATGKRELVQTLVPADRAGVVSIAPVITNQNASGFAYSYDQILSKIYLISGLH